MLSLATTRQEGPIDTLPPWQFLSCPAESPAPSSSYSIPMVNIQRFLHPRPKLNRKAKPATSREVDQPLTCQRKGLAVADRKLDC